MRLPTSSCYDTALHHSFCGTFSLGLGGTLELTGILAHTQVNSHGVKVLGRADDV